MRSRTPAFAPGYGCQVDTTAGVCAVGLPASAYESSLAAFMIVFARPISFGSSHRPPMNDRPTGSGPAKPAATVTFA